MHRQVRSPFRRCIFGTRPLHAQLSEAACHARVRAFSSCGAPELARTLRRHRIRYSLRRRALSQTPTENRGHVGPSANSPRSRAQRLLLSSLVISLDFELFWGVAESRTIDSYRNNIEGEWTAIPRILELFRQYGIGATWATVGMLMCRDHAQWSDVRPSALPTYLRPRLSTYSLDTVAREYPRLFFARPLVEQILATPGQEVGCHTYSHFYCGEKGATPQQFAADLACAKEIASELGVHYQSFVFPRNQVRKEYFAELKNAGICVYRGNPNHWLYRDGKHVLGGLAGRAVRLADTWLPLTGSQVSRATPGNGLTNVAASQFLRPWMPQLAALEPLRLHRLKTAMTAAVRSGGICHLWWHPHNFGVNVENNIAVLESLLRHYEVLRDQYGMRSLTMAGAAQLSYASNQHTKQVR